MVSVDLPGSQDPTQKNSETDKTNVHRKGAYLVKLGSGTLREHIEVPV
jgi:hypothetical protein